MALRAPSVTESPNPLTQDIDTASPAGILRLLRQCDSQVFSGYLTHPCIMDDEMLEVAAQVAWRLSRVLAEGDRGRIVLSGAGTSGRLAVFLAREFNRLLRGMHAQERFHSLIAGGERALIAPVEGAEDQGSKGADDLRPFLDGDAGHSLYIGITAGLSAPYVAAQCEALRESKNWDVVLLGFNPAEMARDERVSPDVPSIAEIIEAMKDEERFFLLNPVYGPEAITGSTRMKGGTTTKLLLETIFHLALELAGMDPERKRIELGTDGSLLPLRSHLLDCYERYRDVFDAAYVNIPALAELVRLGGGSLRASGRIYYIGRGAAGMMGVMDAAECVPTFGADPFDVRAFLREGWSAWLGEGRDLSSNGRGYLIGHSDFQSHFLPSLERTDLVIGIAVSTLGDNTKIILEQSKTQGARTALVLVTAVTPRAEELPSGLDVLCVIPVHSLGFRPGFTNEGELALKLCLNAITTGAHVLAGRVYHNRMIDLRLSNSKLYLRAIRTIMELVGVEEETARVALHKAAFRTERLSEEQLLAEPVAVIRATQDRRGVLPQALLIATGRFDPDTARIALAEDPVVRRVVERSLA